MGLIYVQTLPVKIKRLQRWGKTTIQPKALVFVSTTQKDNYENYEMWIIYLLSLQRKRLNEGRPVKQTSDSCCWKSHITNNWGVKRDEDEYDGASLSMITQSEALSSFAFQIQNLRLDSKTRVFVLLYDLWRCIMHPQYRMCLGLILCVWVHFISLKASVSFASIYNSDSVFYTDGTPGNFVFVSHADNVCKS